MPFEKDGAVAPIHCLNRGAATTVLRGGIELPARKACRIVGDMTSEMLVLAGDRGLLRRDRRRAACHVRQIAMYVCHVVLRLPQAEIGQAFGRDRTTVGHACNVVEDRRDDRDFDAFVTALERMTQAVFGAAEGVDHG